MVSIFFLRTFLRLECGGPCAGCSYTLFFARSASSTPESKAAVHGRGGNTAGNRGSSVEASRGKDLAEQGLVAVLPPLARPHVGRPSGIHGRDGAAGH